MELVWRVEATVREVWAFFVGLGQALFYGNIFR